MRWRSGISTSISISGFDDKLWEIDLLVPSFFQRAIIGFLHSCILESIQRGVCRDIAGNFNQGESQTRPNSALTLEPGLDAFTYLTYKTHTCTCTHNPYCSLPPSFAFPSQNRSGTALCSYHFPFRLVSPVPSCITSGIALHCIVWCSAQETDTPRTVQQVNPTPSGPPSLPKALCLNPSPLYPLQTIFEFSSRHLSTLSIPL